MDILKQKASIRADMKLYMESFEDTCSKDICNYLKKQHYWQYAEHIMLYSTLKGEVDLHSLWSEQRTFYLPRVGGDEMHVYRIDDPHDLDEGAFGVREPKKSCELADLKKLDLIIVPGIAFDLQGGRLGKGKGFYDRFLESLQKMNANVETVSLAFPFQILSSIPMDGHDQYIDHILTVPEEHCL